MVNTLVLSTFDLRWKHFALTVIRRPPPGHWVRETVSTVNVHRSGHHQEFPDVFPEKHHRAECIWNTKCLWEWVRHTQKTLCHGIVVIWYILMVLKFYQEQLVYICLIKNKTSSDTEILVYWKFKNYVMIWFLMDRRKFIKKANVLKTEFRGKFNHVDLWRCLL